MNFEIKLIEQQYNQETFNLDHVYECKFTLTSALEKHELLYGFEEDFIQFMKEDFEKSLRSYLQNSK